MRQRSSVVIRLVALAAAVAISKLASSLEPAVLYFHHRKYAASKSSPRALPQLLVHTVNMWTSADEFLKEIWLLPRLARYAGFEMVPVNSTATRAEKLALADIIILGYYGRDPENNMEVAIRDSHAVTIYIQTENAAMTKYWHMFAGIVDLSWGQRTDLERENGPGSWKRYLRVPWWLPYSLNEAAPFCKLHPSLYKTVNADEWVNRPGFATLLSRHYNYPRPELHSAISAIGRIDCPSEAFHNMEWPSHLPNSHVRGKVEFLQSYRFNVCPENGWSTDDGSKGYNTEKAPQAHIAGAVPVYWGDTIDPEVFNQERILVFKGNNMEALVATMRALEQNSTFRAEWFSRPILQPTADAEVNRLCSAMVDSLRWLLRKHTDRHA